MTSTKSIRVIGRVDVGGDYKVVGNSVVKIDDPTDPDPEPPTGKTELEIAKDFFGSLRAEAVSDYLVENKDAFLTALGIEEDTDLDSVGTVLYDKLQEGGSIVVEMNDGGVITVTGHFDEVEAYWTMNIQYDVPANGTDRCFPADSGKVVKGGSVLLTATEAEITTIGDYGVCIPVYGYKVNINNVTFEYEGSPHVIKVTDLTKPTDWGDPSIIDPDGNTWEIRLYDFKLPPKDAEGQVLIDEQPVSWSEIM